MVECYRIYTINNFGITKAKGKNRNYKSKKKKSQKRKKVDDTPPYKSIINLISAKRNIISKTNSIKSNQVHVVP